MNRPPSIMRLRITDNRKSISLWIPLFIIFLIIAVLFIIFIPFLLIAALVLWAIGWGKSTLMIGPVLLNCVCNLRGLEVEVENPKGNILMSFK